MNAQNPKISLNHLGENRYQARIGAAAYHFEAKPMQDGGWLITLDGQQVQVYAVQHGGAYFVFAEGQQYRVNLAENSANRRSTTSNKSDLSAQMPGQVIALLVKEGESVSQGQALLILEAMKMETRITAPTAGTVRRVLVQAGEIVTQGQMLVELTPA